MISNLIVASVLLGQAPVVEMTPVSASLFKNGYAVVVREATIPAGEFVVHDLPTGSLGTLWITASEGVRLNSVVVTNVEQETEVNLGTLDEILQNNVGKRLSISFQTGPQGQVGAYGGVLKSVVGEILVMEADSPISGTIVIRRSTVTQITSHAGDLVWTTTRKSTRRAMRVNAQAPRDAKLYIVGLERGMTWVPTYSLDISDDKKLKMVSKATLMNDLVDIDNIEVRLVTGFPNIPFLNTQDPLTSGMSVDQWVGIAMQIGTGRDLRREGAMLNQMAARPGASFDAAFPIYDLPGFTAEDLFFYRQPNVTLKRGDRGYYVLFAAESDYSHLYEWEIGDRIEGGGSDGPGDVWHSLKFHNTSGRPLTTAAATTFKNGEVIGQDMLNYTTAGAEATVKITKALDVRAEDDEEEIARERNALNIRGVVYDLVTLRGNLRVRNLKSESVRLKITKFLTGEVIEAQASPKVTSIARGLRVVNLSQRVEWEIDVRAGESREITYTYKVYVNR